MVNENLKLIAENKKPVEMVYELKNEAPSFEEFMKTYENDGDFNYADLNSDDIGTQKGYGPCKRSLCGCSCSSSECKCKSVGVSIKDSSGYSFLSHSASGRKWQKEIDPTDWDELVLKAAGTKDMEASGQVSSSALGYKDSGGELKLLSGTAGGEISRSGFKGKLSADLVNIKSDGIQMRAGVAADTSFSVEDGLEIKAVGFGFSVSDKQVGFSLPIGEVKVDTDECVIQ